MAPAMHQSTGGSEGKRERERVTGGWKGEETGLAKRGLEYGVRAPVFYGNLLEQTGENSFPRRPTGSLFCYCTNLRKPPGGCNLGILYSSSLLLLLLLLLSLLLLVVAAVVVVVRYD